jgi:hypothetical protein
MKVDAGLGCYIVKLHPEGVCKVRTVAEGFSLSLLLLLLIGAQSVANQPGGKIARSKKEHAYCY